MSDPKKSKNILLLGLVSLLNDISSEIIQPVLPIFIATLGGSSIAIGLIAASATACQASSRSLQDAGLTA